MKNTKKVLSVALAGALAFGSMGSAFAMDAKLTEGIDNKDVVKAIEKLSAFDIVNGMEDGKYHAEGELTRAQFAKMLVEALGLGSAAQNSTQKPAFNDVDASSQWAWGYINVAQGQGLLSGYPDGTFKPSAKVSYAEALTMLVRSLGYKDEFLSGSWPGNYMAKAADVDVTDGVTVDGSAVNRGAAALLLSNTLDANIIKQETFGDDDNWKVDDTKTLIEDKLDVEKYEDAQVVAIPRVDNGIDKDQIKITYKDDNNKDKDKTVDVDLEKVSIDNLLGEGLNVYYDTNKKEVVFVEKSDKEFKTYYDVVDKGEDIKKDEFTIIKADKELNIDEDAIYYIDNKEVKQSEFETEAKKGNLFVKAVANEKGNITIVDAQKFEVNQNGVVAVESSKDELKYIADASGDKDDTKIVKAKDFDKVVVMDNNGNAMKLEDIKKDDVVYVNKTNLDGKDLIEASSKDEVLQLLVVRSVVEGKGSSYKVDTDKKTGTIEIDGKDYDAAEKATISLNEDKDVVAFISTDGKKKLEDLTDEEAKVVAFLDVTGDVRHVRTDVKNSSDDLFGIVAGVDTRYDDTTLKIFNQEGKEVEYKLDLDDNEPKGATEAYLGTTAVKYDVVKFTVDKDGEIDTLKVIAKVDENKTATATTEGYVKTLNDDADVKKESIKIDGSYRTVADDIVAIDYTEAYNDAKTAINKVKDAEILKWTDLVDDKTGSNAQAIYSKDDNGAIEFIVFTHGFSAGSEDVFAGYVVDKRGSSDKDKVDMVVEGTDKVVRYEVDSIASGVTLKDEMPIVFKKNADGTIKVVSTGDEYRTFKAVVEDIDSRYVKFKNDTKTYKLSSDAVYYEEDDAKGYSDLDEGDAVYVAVDGSTIKVVELLKDAEKDAVIGSGGNSGGDNTDTNTVQYINAQGNMIVADKTYTINDTTILKDENGRTIAIGKASINTLLSADTYKVKDIEVEDGAVKKFTKLFTDAEKLTNKAEEVKALIVAIPAKADVTVAHKAQVEKARVEYDKLIASQKTTVGDITKLTEAETKLAELGSTATVEEVKGLIAALPAAGDVTVAHKAQIEAARAAFVPLTSAQKTAVGSIAKLTAAEGALATAEANAATAAANTKAVADAKAALTTLVVTKADQAKPEIAVPAPASGVAYSFAGPSNFNGNDDGTTPGAATDADPVVITRDASTLFTFEIEVTFTKGAATDTKVFVVTVPTGTDAPTVTAK